MNAVVAPDLVRDFGVSPAELGLLTSAYLLSLSAVSVAFGGPARPLRRTEGADGASGHRAREAVFSLPWRPDFLSLVGARAIIGLGFSAGLMASYKSSSIWVPIERRSLANASIMSAGPLALPWQPSPPPIW